MNISLSTALIPLKTEIKPEHSGFSGFHMAKRENHMIVRDLSRPEPEQEMTFLGYRHNGCSGEYNHTGNIITKKTTGRCINVVI